MPKLYYIQHISVKQSSNSQPESLSDIHSLYKKRRNSKEPMWKQRKRKPINKPPTPINLSLTAKSYLFSLFIFFFIMLLQKLENKITTMDHQKSTWILDLSNDIRFWFWVGFGFFLVTCFHIHYLFYYLLAGTRLVS